MSIGFNEVIDVRDESIIRNNEHPRFKIGDVINNGYGNFIVTGFTRSTLGLCYVLDNGHGLIGWLTKQVDTMCYFVGQKQSMNNIPDKIYIREVDLVKVGNSLSDNNDKTDIEYIRKDVFIDKACNWLEPVLKNHAGYYAGKGILEDFKNYMKGK